MIFVQGLAMPMRAFVGYIYIMEFLSQKKAQVFSAIVMGFDGLVLVVAALWFLYVSQNWKSLWLMATILQYGVILLICTFPESPKFLVSVGKFEQARTVMTRIAHYNRITEFDFTEEEKRKHGAVI